MYLGTSKNGVLRSLDAGRTWQEANKGLTYKEVWWVDQHPRTGELYAGGGPVSIFKSVDRGDTWTDCDQLRTLPTTKHWTFPMPPHVAHVKFLQVSRDDPNVVWAALEEGWLLRSTDGGKTWQNQNEGNEIDAHTAYTLPGQAGLVLSTSGTGVYRSEDGGDHFVKSSDGMEHAYTMHVAFDPKDSNVMYTAAAELPPPFWNRPDRPQGANTGFYRSDDRGKSWKRLRDGLPDPLPNGPRSVAGDPEDRNVVFVGMTHGGVWATEDGGGHWQKTIDLAGALPAGNPMLAAVTSIRVAYR
jgi:photosystem II stability/assembly factor-like uncharacterized protein